MAKKAKPQTHKEDPILSPSEAGKLINKSGQTIRNWMRDGLLQTIKFPGGGYFGVRESEILKLIHNSNLAETLTDGN